MPDEKPSFFRHGSARFLLGGALLCAVLLLARQHMLAALGVMVVVAAAGALRRAQEEASRRPRPSPLHPPVNAFRPISSGLATRQTLEARLAEEWARERPPGDPTAVVLIAIDAFDHLREQGGAMAGDVAMLTLASALSRMLPRGADLLVRYNDSTFAVLLSGTDLPGSLRVAARLRWSIVRLGIANAGTASGFLTACTGVAVQHGMAKGGTPALLAAAEGALAAAQLAGHDRLEYAVLGSDSLPDSHALQASIPSLDSASAPDARLPAIRAWTPERAPALHSRQSSPVA